MEKIIITIDKKKKEYSIPTDWSEVTVKQYRDLNSLHITDELTILQKRVLLVSVFIGLDKEFIYEHFSIQDLEFIESKLDFLGTEMVMENVKYIDIEDERFYLFEDLNNLKTGEIITLETLIKDSNGNLLSVYNKLLCIFLRKGTEDGEMESFKLEHLKRAEMFDKLPIAKVNSLMVFFSNIVN